ncbi:hypothetical protein EYR40_006042 [Pleurotus pulmonarius]|nr:hypothetical protein EYR40_006042 [Pleurotus pulmonarius]
MSTTSPVQHALSIRELLFRIFSNSNTDSNAVNARVCKLWANEALSINWYSIDADALLNLLKLEGPQAWVRFDEYAWRVHVLSVGIDFDFPYIVRSQILTTKFNRNRPLVPNLTTLTIDFDFDSVNDIIYLFESPSVRSLTLSPYIFDDLWMCSKPFEMALKILRSALVNMPSLRTLRVPEYRECEGGSIAVQAFTSIIGEFDQLEEVQIPAFWLADPVVDSLASLPGLRSLDIPMLLSPSPALFTTIPPISDSYFPSLEALRMDTSFSKAIKWLSHPRFPKTLTSLSIHLRRNGVDRSADCLAHLFAAIGSQLRNLRTLDFEEPSFHRFDASCSFESMRPLLSLSDLRHMTLKMRYTIVVVNICIDL